LLAALYGGARKKKRGEKEETKEKEGRIRRKQSVGELENAK